MPLCPHCPALFHFEQRHPFNIERFWSPSTSSHSGDMMKRENNLKILNKTLAFVALLAMLLALPSFAGATQNATAEPAAQKVEQAPAADTANAGATRNATAGAVAQKVEQAPAADTAKLSRLEAAIAQAPLGTGPGQIDKNAAPGFLDIPGAPQLNLMIAFAWAVWVGWLFSTVGAFGGVMAGVGHMSVLGLGAYASTFKGTKAMNTVITDSIRVSNQCLVGFSALVSSIKYFSLGRIVLPLGIALGIGSVAGSVLIPMLTQGKISFRDYVGYFGLFVLLLGCYLFYETTAAGQARRKKASAAAKAFEEASKKNDNQDTGVKVTSITASRVTFTFCGVEFSFSTFVPVIGGFIIASAASFLGVGGGFLLVPFLTSIAQLPMYLAAGTSAFAVLVGMVTSITTFVSGGTPIYWNLVGIELVGILVGSWVGPITAKYIPDMWLKRLFVVVAIIVGTNYVLRGFFDMRLF